MQRIKDNKIRYLTHINHEVRNPLSSIFSAVSLLKNIDGDSLSQHGTTSDAKNKILDSLQSTCDHLLSVVNDTLDFERLSSKSGRSIEDEYVDFDPRTIALNSINVLAAKATEKSLVVSCRVALGVGAKYKGSPTRIQQVLVNLISNAIQHSGGDVTVSIRAGEGWLIYEVSDVGRGISEAGLKTLFEPFSSSLGYRGTSGLGLSISKMLVEDLMRGSLLVDSVIDKGTTFTVRLPLKPGVDEFEALAVYGGDKKRTLDNTASLQGLRVLFVEDDEVNSELTSLVFERHGIVVTRALNSTQALDLQGTKGPFDIGVVDSDLGVWSALGGVELARALRSGGLKKIIGFTGNYSEALASDWRAVGVNQIILKPASVESILDALRSLNGARA